MFAWSDWSMPLSIFGAEMCVITVATLRIIFIAQGRKYLAPVLGCVEVMTWLYAIGRTMKNLDDPACFLAFALGFTVGNLLGILIEKALAMGMVHVRIITHRDAQELVEALRADNFGVTCVDGEGATGRVHIVLTVVRRRMLPHVVKLIELYQPHAFYAVDALQTASEGIFPLAKERPGVLPLPLKNLLATPRLRHFAR